MTVLKMGTEIKAPMPRINIKLPVLTEAAEDSVSSLNSPKVPFMVKVRKIKGTSVHTMLGIKRPFMMAAAEICPPIQSIVVVTSPIGDQAPPALAAITIIPAKNRRISLSGINLRTNETITMVVVRLSNTEDRKKATIQTTQRRAIGFLVLIRSVMNLNPWCASTNSTIVIAPIKKKRICAISLRWWPNCSTTYSRCSSPALREAAFSPSS